MSVYGGKERSSATQPHALANAVSPAAEAAIRPTFGPVRATMARWRLWLLAWMQRHEYPEWRALGIPEDRVQVVDITIEMTSELELDIRGTWACADGIRDAEPTWNQSSRVSR